MKDKLDENTRQVLLAGKITPNGKCVICGKPVNKDNRFLCTYHHIVQLENAFNVIREDVIRLVCAYYGERTDILKYPITDKQGNKYSSLGAYIDLDT